MTRAPGRTRAERGATMLEFALVLPFLLLMAFGTAEMGLAWVANNRVEGSSSTAARIGASSGSLAEADRNILVSLRSSLPASELANLDRVVVFKPTDADGTVPTACIKAAGDGSQVGVSTQCNTYSGDTVRTVSDTTDLGSADDYWAPSTRKDSLAGPPDRIGIWLRTTHPAQTGTFWSEFTITKSSIYRIQPDING
ncbi:MAG: TadE/TadG family type IV pilus assembly protein [Microthrixaceae bacterium]